MILNLPRDLIHEIFSRVPMESIKAVRLTCKSWNSLSKSESFAKMHNSKSTRKEESMMIVVQPHNVYLMSGVVDVDPCIDLKGKLIFLNNQVNISRIDHYEGLLLCILKDLTRIVVWNPYLGQTRWIKPRYSHCPQGHDVFDYSLGYEDKESCRSLKLLRFVDFLKRAPEELFFWYEIYNFDSGLWTTLDVAPHWTIYCTSSSVSLKGNSYWCARERSSKGCPDHIICFDFTRERFGPLLPLASCVRDRNYAYVTLSCVKEEKIAALFHHHNDYESEIWITTKIEAEMVSWSKLFRIETDLRIHCPYCFFINEEKKVLMCVGSDYRYDSDWDECPKTFIEIIGEAGYSKKLDLGVPAYKNSWLFSACSYVPSLVQIKKLSRVDRRIEQSSIEKRLFDQNMLRLAEIEKLMKYPCRHRCR